MSLDLISLPKEITLTHYNEIPVLAINHPECRAKIALQGAHLFSWQPKHSEQDLFWLSDVEPFKLGNAIRGGVPICYPWFGGVKQPSHGTARLRLWALSEAQVKEKQVNLTFLLKDDNGQPEAQMQMSLGESCLLTFTHLGREPAQLALHSYFKVKEIEQVAIFGLPDNAFNSLIQQRQAVSSPRKIAENVDEIYTADGTPSVIHDLGHQRQIEIAHQNASEIVVWNPWHKATSGMSETGYRTMVCVETANIHRLLQSGEQTSVKISVKPL